MFDIDQKFAGDWNVEFHLHTELKGKRDEGVWLSNKKTPKLLVLKDNLHKSEKCLLLTHVLSFIRWHWEQFQITLETYFPFPCSCWLKADWMPKIDWIHFTQLLEEEEGPLFAHTGPNGPVTPFCVKFLID
jgi:hypothetical protein